MAKKRHHGKMRDGYSKMKSHPRMDYEDGHMYDEHGMIQRYGTGMYESEHANTNQHEVEGNPRASRKNAILGEDHRAMANLPQEVVMEYYPKNRSMMPNFMDDTIEGIDRQMNADSSIGRGILKPRKA